MGKFDSFSELYFVINAIEARIVFLPVWNKRQSETENLWKEIYPSCIQKVPSVSYFPNVIEILLLNIIRIFSSTYCSFKLK